MLLLVILIAAGPVRGEEQAAFDICNAPLMIRSCKALVKRFAYDSQLGKCTQMSYGVCGGISNDFSTQESCEDATAKCPPRAAFNVCNADLVTGPCRAILIRYGYNAKVGKCEEFEYGGCRGNANRFETETDCEIATASCPNRAAFDVCNAPLVTGPCKGKFIRYGYNAKVGKCEQFVYGGCDGNANRFEAEGDCEIATATCPNKAAFDVCNAPLVTGPCKAKFIRYGYNANVGKCEQFVYGGCGGNANRFETESDCEIATASCPNKAAFNICYEPLVTGPCKERFILYGYNTKIGKCEQFEYGGCDGNENRFETEEDCEIATAICPNKAAFDLCNAPLLTGTCKAKFISYGYNAKVGKCEQFVYGGCGGNANRFETESDCEIATATCPNKGIAALVESQ